MSTGSQRNLTFDALVLGGGIAGLEAALNLAEQDFSVAVVEQDDSIGGKMIRLSKVFPTLDCSSCITTPKMAAAAHHPNITLFTYCELQSLAARATSWWRRSGKSPATWTKKSASAAASANIDCPGAGAGCRAGRVCGPEGHLHPLLQRHSPKGPDRPGKLHPVRPLRQDLSHRGGQLLSRRRRISP